MTGRPHFWSSLFRRQPIEHGVDDPIEADLDRVRSGVQKATNDLSESINALLDDLAQRQTAKRKEGSRHV